MLSERAADRTIYSDDVDAVEQLRERIAELEGQRERRKVINREIRRGEGWEARLEPPLTEAEREELLGAARFDGFRGYPPYAMSNLTGNISRQRKRLGSLAATRADPNT